MTKVSEYVAAKVNVQLHDLLGQGVEGEELNHLIPCEIGAADEESDPLLAIQVNIFACGGLAVGGCFSHRIADASTVASFICGWATAISTLRAMCHGPRVSSVQLVNAILWKALIGVDNAKHGQSRASILVQSVNLRGKTNPPLPQHTFGNLWGLATTQVKAGDNMAFQDFVDLLGGSVRKYVKDCGNALSNGEDGYKVVIDPFMESHKIMSNSEVNFCSFSSWSKFPIYEADFGLGKPIWASVVNMPVKNVVILMDDKKGEGIEAWVHLDAADMPIF
ncbi:hypothetical protein RJ639_041054 [Escallonia herrerae]|uniref:Uncharacterized protein n=1 Tax=Escallonia herrerae TaxID=1293975 RepID=A0AA89B5X8_9ASTE|nr:hypothetical protein RJ639_041054 [Escallonia herrerae]